MIIVENSINKIPLYEVKKGTVFCFPESSIPYMKVKDYDFYIVNLKTGELKRYPTYRQDDIVEIFPDVTMILRKAE